MASIHDKLGRVRKPRVHLSYEVETEGAMVEKTLPFVVGVMGDFSGFLNKDTKELHEAPVNAAMLAGMLKRILDNTISGKIAKDVFEAMWNGEGDADAVIEKKGLKQITDTGAIEKVIDEVLAANPDSLAAYLK